MLHGNFGYSYVQNTPVLPTILSRFPVTAQLALGGVVVELLIGLPTGVIAAYRRGSVGDRAATLFALLGLSEPVILLRHVLPNAITPIVTQIGIDLGYFLGGVFIVEAVFGLPGIGQQAIEAIGQLDIPIIMGTVLFAALLIVISNIVVKLSFALIDPRVRYH